MNSHVYVCVGHVFVCWGHVFMCWGSIIYVLGVMHLCVEGGYKFNYHAIMTTTDNINMYNKKTVQHTTVWIIHHFSQDDYTLLNLSWQYENVNRCDFYIFEGVHLD